MEQRRTLSEAEYIDRIRRRTGKDSPLIGTIVRRYALELDDIHGVEHWLRVYDNGTRLAPLTGADRDLITWFALIHDSCRRSNGFDPRHGLRAADFAAGHRAEIDLDDAGFELLREAVACHTAGCSTDAHPGIRTCLDADRLDIGRVGLRVDPDQLFTEAGKEEARRRGGYAEGGRHG